MGRTRSLQAATVAVVAAVVVTLVGCGQPPGAEGRDGDRAAAPAGRVARPFRTRAAMSHVRHLAHWIGVRVRARRGEFRASRYIARTFRSFGYRVRVQKFSVDGDTSRNVIAKWPGGVRGAMVVGAHMDTVARSPGANDNASGVGILLETARIFAGTRQARLTRFVAFGAEEYGRDGRHHVGSQVYVNRLGRRGRRIAPGMVSVDMVADGRPLIIGETGFASSVVARTLTGKLRRSGFAVDYRMMCDCSDHGPFERAGISGAMMWSGPEPNYHAPSDTVGNLRRRDLERSGRAVRVFVKSFRRELLDRFRRG